MGEGGRDKGCEREKVTEKVKEKQRVGGPSGDNELISWMGHVYVLAHLQASP